MIETNYGIRIPFGRDVQMDFVIGLRDDKFFAVSIIWSKQADTIKLTIKAVNNRKNRRAVKLTVFSFKNKHLNAYCERCESKCEPEFNT